MLLNQQEKERVEQVVQFLLCEQNEESEDDRVVWQSSGSARGSSFQRFSRSLYDRDNEKRDDKEQEA